MRCSYNEVNFLQNPHYRHPIAHSWGRVMGFMLWFYDLIHFLPLLSQCCMQHCDKLDWVYNSSWLYFRENWKELTRLKCINPALPCLTGIELSSTWEFLLFAALLNIKIKIFMAILFEKERGSFSPLSFLALVIPKLFLRNTKIYLHFLALPNTEMAQEVEILPHWRQGPVYPAEPIL